MVWSDLHRLNLLGFVRGRGFRLAADWVSSLRSSWRASCWSTSIQPALVLRKIVASMIQDPVDKLVITVPNAFSLRNLLHVLRGYEKVAPDHVSYYSFSNVRELAERNGYQLDRVSWYRYSPVRKVVDRVVDAALAPIIWFGHNCPKV